MNGKGSGYIPGVCNLGKEEANRRYRMGIVGLVIMVITIFVIEVFELNRSFRWIVFAPAVFTTAAFFQAYSKFCFNYGLRGVFSVKGLRNFEASTDIQADRKQALKLIIFSFIAALAAITLYFFLPR